MVCELKIVLNENVSKEWYKETSHMIWTFAFPLLVHQWFVFLSQVGERKSTDLGDRIMILMIMST